MAFLCDICLYLSQAFAKRQIEWEEIKEDQSLNESFVCHWSQKLRLSEFSHKHFPNFNVLNIKICQQNQHLAIETGFTVHWTKVLAW